MSEEFTVRLFEPDDLPAVLRLWRDDSGWSGITEQQWRSWYVDTPWGQSIIPITEDSSGEVVGQGVMSPFRLRVGSQRGLGHRVSAPILRSDIRTGSALSPNHPTRKMLELGMMTAKQQGSLLAYAMPLAAWRGFFRRIPGFQQQLFNCAKIDLNEVGTKSNRNHLQVEQAFNMDSEHIQLWEAALQNLQVQAAVERNEELFAYRLKNQLTLNVRYPNGELIGYMAIKPQTGLVLDVVARRAPDIGDVIRAVVQALTRGEYSLDSGVESLKIMVTPQIQPYLEAVQALPDDYRFLFCVCPLSEHIEPEKLSPSEWYLTGGD